MTETRELGLAASGCYVPAVQDTLRLESEVCGVGGVQRAISLTQPWATLVMLGEKKYETRCWRTKFRGPVWMHAAKGFPGWAKELCECEPFASVLASHGYRSWKELPTAGLLGTMEWLNCERTEDVLPRISDQEANFGDYSAGRFASLLGNPMPLANSVPCKGALSFWRVPIEALRAAGVGFKTSDGTERNIPTEIRDCEPYGHTEN